MPPLAIAALIIASPVCFVLGVLWASRPKDPYIEAGWRCEEQPQSACFYRTKEIEK